MQKPSTNRKRIGLAAVNALPVNSIVWDADLKGFCIRRQRSDVSYMLKTRVKGRIRWFTIGRHGQPWTPDTARKRALQILADPLVADKPPLETTQTFSAVAEQFLENHGTKIKDSTLQEYRSLVNNYLLPAFGRLSLDSITRADISEAHARWKAKPRAANHALSVLSKLMTWAEDQGYRAEGTNPCRRVQRYKENKRERFLQLEEIRRLGKALDEAADRDLVGPFALAAIRLLVLTGARLSEILTLEWSFVDFERKLLLLPDSKTGKKPIVLNDAAIVVLKALPRFERNPYVIVGNRHRRHLINLHKPFQIVCGLARLDGLRMHDLRHTWASLAIAAGGSLPVLGRHLGHMLPQTTARYAHLTDDPVRVLAQSTGKTIDRALRGQDSKKPPKAAGKKRPQV
ncbi:site-specific integrase [Hyphomicrobium sp. LHD-15]|uniref:tyrosine-type recombinase/integrase n=1 Tax=Hyphomicrobium sp. LHD-15 TaxID=3072142 RepID=UPI00280ED941|nr:site-specific integrase [Hyphomicrobium sp. LHD-15]MDQ8699246.1 site-specific integrase [Hyphomicrobium sp. LHD-15]